ncbi:LOW QUALITY PROTEIN: hypothetical protein Cgig2_023642 [Carnegiea gigantea]|uniref:Uncharacterized protein n=1 Tax=Carnegiea gigantea TaxID=171969 RepID=A0A9Q1KEL9_9CARY|nr:LOW QUALITY PROTEIN: hypothetical protein Cgig2_023642 [Carnegiea gigantea]
MDGDGVVVGGSGGGRELLMCYGGELDDGGGGKVTYVGGWTKCMVLKEDIVLEEMRRKVSEIIGNELTMRKLWYSLKYDRGMVMELEGDGDSDVRMFLKENDEHGYLYVGESDGPKRHIQKATRTCDDGIVRGRSGRDRDDMVQQGRNGAGVKKATVSGRGGCSDNHPQTRLRVSGDIIEMSDDDEISVASEDLVKNMDKHKQETMKWKNGVGERIEQKLADTYQKMGCIATVECYSLMLGKYSVKLTNSRKLVVKLGQQTCTCRVYNYVHPIYKTATQQIIYNQLVHLIETYDMGIVDVKTGRVVSGDELDDDYDHCILPPTNGRQPGRPPSKCRES